MFLDIESRETHAFEMYVGKPLDADKLTELVGDNLVISFNGIHYDMVVLALALAGKAPPAIKIVSDQLILENKKHWELGIEPFSCNHIDLFNVAPGVGAGLKVYAGRMAAPKMQDLPIDPAANIKTSQREQLREYCINDLENTELLYKMLAPQIALREAMTKEYGLDLRSKSDAQIAEAVIKSKVEAIKGEKVYKPRVSATDSFKYRAPNFIQFKTNKMKAVLEFVKDCKFTLVNGSPKCPELEGYALAYDEMTYTMGMGGLHSTEKNTSHVAGEDYVLIDRDVASYYPSIILNCKLYPKHMGEDFLTVYRDIVNRRLEAKRSGDKVAADALKITINGSFGKFGSQYSTLYAPDLLIQTTVTGQLALLMLIESLSLKKIKVVSANTDGIVIKCPTSKQEDLAAVVADWERMTGLVTEETRYKGLYSRDVNNFVAIKEDGEVKTKGVFAATTLMKSPANSICPEAVVQFLAKGVPIEETIRSCNDISKFVTIKRVTGGGECNGTYLGKTVRWYYGKGVDSHINYVGKTNKVGTSDGAVPIMELPKELPKDIDYDKYIDISKKLLSQLNISVI